MAASDDSDSFHDAEESHWDAPSSSDGTSSDQRSSENGTRDSTGGAEAGECASSAPSILDSSLKKYGGMSYYYAHNRKFEIPEDAKVVSGPGIITGGAPVLVQVGSRPDLQEAARVDESKLTKYSWCDNTNTVKLYFFRESLPDELQSLQEDDVTVEFAERRLDVVLCGGGRKFSLRLPNLSAAVEPDQSSWQLASAKLVITLRKQEPDTWFDLVAKNV